MTAAFIEPLLALAGRALGGEAVAGAAEAGAGKSMLGKAASFTAPTLNGSGQQGRRAAFDEGVAEPIRPL